MKPLSIPLLNNFSIREGGKESQREAKASKHTHREFKRDFVPLNINNSPSLDKGGGLKGEGYLIKIKGVRSINNLLHFNLTQSCFDAKLSGVLA